MSTIRCVPLIPAIIVLTLPMTFIGCSPSDERLVQLAQQSIQTQHEQNSALCQQSAAVIQASHELATGARQLVVQDAQARRELIQTQAHRQEQWQADSGQLDRQRAELDAERRDLDLHRQIDPIVAAALVQVGTLLACLAPLVLAAYALRQFGQTNHQTVELGEVLLAELTAVEPLFHGWPEQPRLPGSDSRPTSIRG